MTLPSLAIVGTGPVAYAIGSAQRAAGGGVVAVVSRDAERARRLGALVRATTTGTTLDLAVSADVVLVAVSDAAIAAVAGALRAAAAGRDVLALHTSGALSGAELSGGGIRGGSLHPLQALPRLRTDDPAGTALLAERLHGAHWFHEGAGAEAAARFVDAWGGHFHALADGARSKSLYHAGAAVLSNHTVALHYAAMELFRRAGVSRADAAEPLAELLLGTARNVAALGSPDALTGPIARGDVATVERHLEAIRAAAPELLPSYVEVARLTLEVAREKADVDPATLDALERALRDES